MTKKTRAPVAKFSKRREDDALPGKRAAASGRPIKKAPMAAPKRQAAPDGAGPSIRRLRVQLAQALMRIEELQAVADTDFLLGIPNRRGFTRELNRAIAYIKRYRANAALIMLDVDRLKPINDAFGHAAGDQVLQAVVATLVAEVRASDVIGRLGGDEFALLLWNLSEIDARAKSLLLEQAVDRLTFDFGNHTVTIGASAGTAILGRDADANNALEAADRAMYLRKAQRRNGA